MSQYVCVGGGVREWLEELVVSFRTVSPGALTGHQEWRQGPLMAEAFWWLIFWILLQYESHILFTSFKQYFIFNSIWTYTVCVWGGVVYVGACTWICGVHMKPCRSQNTVWVFCFTIVCLDALRQSLNELKACIWAGLAGQWAIGMCLPSQP